jgi:hypothetical protein
MPATPRHLIFHVGTHKTGTTSIQTMMQDNRDYFEEQGILFPRSGQVRNGGQHNLAWELNGDEGFDPALGTLRDLESEIAASTVSDVVLTSEDFEFWYDEPNKLQQIADLAQRCGMSIDVILVIRPVRDYVESLFKELLKHGLLQTREEFVAQLLRDGHYEFRERTYRFDYPAMVRGFSDVFGADRVWVVKYNILESNQPFFDVVSRLVGRSVRGIPNWGRKNQRNGTARATLRHPISALRRMREPGKLKPQEASAIGKMFPAEINSLIRLP